MTLLRERIAAEMYAVNGHDMAETTPWEALTEDDVRKVFNLAMADVAIDLTGAIPPHFRPGGRVALNGVPATVLRTNIEFNRSTAWVSYLVELDRPVTGVDELRRPYTVRRYYVSHCELTPLDGGAR